MVIKGLTLIRPWSWAIVHASKRIENRTWKPNLAMGDWIAIHAGSKWIQTDANWIADTFCYSVPPKEEQPAGVIIGVARYAGWTTGDKSPWFFGPYGWLLSDVSAIEQPIPHTGALSLWNLQPEALALVQAHILKGGE